MDQNKRYKIIYRENDDEIVGLTTNLKITYDEDGTTNEVQDELNELKKTYHEKYLEVEETWTYMDD